MNASTVAGSASGRNRTNKPSLHSIDQVGKGLGEPLREEQRTSARPAHRRQLTGRDVDPDDPHGCHVGSQLVERLEPQFVPHLETEPLGGHEAHRHLVDPPGVGETTVEQLHARQFAAESAVEVDDRKQRKKARPRAIGKLDHDAGEAEPGALLDKGLGKDPTELVIQLVGGAVTATEAEFRIVATIREIARTRPRNAVLPPPQRSPFRQ